MLNGMSDEGENRMAKNRYELRHPRYGTGYAYKDLDRARRELRHAVPADGTWVIYDRAGRCEVK